MDIYLFMVTDLNPRILFSHLVTCMEKVPFNIIMQVYTVLSGFEALQKKH